MSKSKPPEWKSMDDHPDEFCDGDIYLFALRVGSSNTPKVTWEFHKACIDCDSETPVSLYYADTEGVFLGHREPFDAWGIDDFEFYIKVSDDD